MKAKTTLAIMSLLLLSSCTPDIRLSSGQAYFKNFTYSGNDKAMDFSQLGEGEILNPLLQGSYSDASICRKGDDYYMVTANYTFFPGIPVLHSKDLVNWEQIGYALSTDQQLPNSSLKADQGIYSPTIRYNEHNNMFYIAGTLVGGGGHFLLRADSPEGPWGDPIWMYGLGGVHPSLFFDGDGKAYIVNQGNPNYTPPYQDYKVIWLQEFDLNSMKPKGERRIILAGGDDLSKKPSWLENPHIFKNGKYYILLASEGGSLGNGFATCAYRSENIWGPYEHYSQNPILTQRRLSADRPNAVTNTGHVDMVETHTGEWWAVFQGVRPYSAQNDYNIGRETFIYPVTWDNGWPYIIRNGENISLKVKAPFGAKYEEEVPYAKYIPHGNFTYEELFLSDTLPLQWEHLRTPPTNPFAPNGAQGLVLPLSNNNLRSQRHTGFIAMRQMHEYFCIETEMHFMPENTSEFAGVAMYLNDVNNYQFGVTLISDETPILAIQQPKKMEYDEISKEDIKIKQLKEGFVGKIFLRIERRDDGYAFMYKFNKEDAFETLLSGVPVETMSLYKNSGFFGVMVGPYASAEDGN